MPPHGNKCQADGHTFDSTAEMRRYHVLMLMQAAGEISGLEVHPRFELQPRRDTIKVINYTADFSYIVDGRRVVEDVKPWRRSKATGKLLPICTEAFSVRWRMAQYQHPEIVFRIVEG